MVLVFLDQQFKNISPVFGSTSNFFLSIHRSVRSPSLHSTSLRVRTIHKQKLTFLPAPAPRHWMIMSQPGERWKSVKPVEPFSVGWTVLAFGKASQARPLTIHCLLLNIVLLFGAVEHRRFSRTVFFCRWLSYFHGICCVVSSVPALMITKICPLILIEQAGALFLYRLAFYQPSNWKQESLLGVFILKYSIS